MTLNAPAIERTPDAYHPRRHRARTTAVTDSPSARRSSERAGHTRRPATRDYATRRRAGRDAAAAPEQWACDQLPAAAHDTADLIDGDLAALITGPARSISPAWRSCRPWSSQGDIGPVDLDKHDSGTVTPETATTDGNRR